LAFYGAVCAAGVGAGMLLEVWIKKKIKGAFSCYMAWQKRPLYGLMNCIRYYI
jgi:hypothetical protein